MGPSGSQIGTTGWICRIFLLLGRRMEERNLKTGKGSKGLVVWRDSIFWGDRPVWHVSCFYSQHCRLQPKEEGKMTRQVEINGRQVKLYRVSGFENAWCSDPGLATSIGRRRQALLRELKSTAEDIVALTEQNFDEEEYTEDNAA